MASSNNTTKGEGAGTGAPIDEADVARVWTDLLKGEKTAQALESNLTSLEKKIDDLLNSFEESERLKVEEANSKAAKPEHAADEETASRTKADFKPTAPLVEVTRDDRENPASSGIESNGINEESEHVTVEKSDSKN